MIHTERIERHLTEQDIQSIRELAERLGIAPDSWPLHKLFVGWLHVAIGAAVKEWIRTGKAASFSRAQELVCGHFGISFLAVRRREQRARKNRRQFGTHEGRPVA